MSCTVCGNGERVPATKPYVEERDGHIAVVTGVPVTICESCGATWLEAPVAHALDALLSEILSQDTLGVRAFAEPAPAA
ncbi:type II toxin-antitoxin system MqsA family antitoxin [Salana multivorans]